MAGWWRRRPALVLVLVAVLGSTLSAAPTTSAGAGTAPARAVAGDRPAVIGKRVIGHSVRGRPLVAWHLGEVGKPKVLLVSTMHGDEPHTRQILTALRDGRPIHGINLWVLPTYNPDGLARGTRKNARGVDLNRNFPNNWADLDGDYESGPRPGSEPETRAVMRFLRNIRPRWIISFHQPLYGVDTVTKNKRFSRKVARALNLPRKSFTCGGVCHGTMTGWYNNRFRGAALTAEYGAHPSRRRMQVTAPRQVLSIWGASRQR
ncbi:M14 family zinc carboxypeptidase [Nocardioides bizhenqiangii]|uniref:M14 family zinc carboxypeptidase n=1 Tax=Nocardioides bizhenqiangii TaxID=3095076 RepID=A0ABZ0ZNZ9_9ACTN|nr:MULTISPECIES: M14 family zinc carboxypeptidase [unclassified Nocardioides]MDZ5620060.1 M14 family zinc carboxypeptidase [Nocardioides sp. HM23]WQQ25938.1 M14 family zinc carboxypeptidase [Nocardioides sp. HM61]